MYSGYNHVPDELILSFEERPAALIRLPDALAEFKRTGNVRSYGRDSLYEYVNGHAEFFLSSGFVSLTVADYTAKGGGQIVVEMYDMEDDRNAKGVATAEKGNAPFVKSVGSAAFALKGSFLFSKGRYYVRLGMFNADDESALRLASTLAAMIKEEPAPAVTRLPLAGKMENSESFMKSDYMGLSFLADVSTAGYRLDAARLEGFSWNGGAGEFIKFFNGEGADIKTSRHEGFERYLVRARYEGTIHLVSDGRNTIGLRGDFTGVNPESIEEFMQQAGDNLRR